MPGAYLRELFENARQEGSVLRDIDGLVSLIGPVDAINSLSQAAVRLTAPGVPDLYQGTKTWDFSLVDPDNRRLVDFASLRASLGSGPDWSRLLANWRDGRINKIDPDPPDTPIPGNARRAV